MEILESLDRRLMRQILGTPTSTPIPSLYLELGCIPITFIIKAKRLIFLQYILKLKREETVSKVFWAQKENPVKNDWYSQIEEDLKEFGLNHFSMEQIAKMSENLFKKFVKESCKRKAFEYLLSEKENLSKLENNCYSNLKIQNYLSSPNLTIRQKKIMFKLRTRMTKVGYNFGKKVLCPLCLNHEDNQEEMLECVILKLQCKELYQKDDEKYDDVFSADINKISKI